MHDGHRLAIVLDEIRISPQTVLFFFDTLLQAHHFLIGVLLASNLS